MKVFLTGATGFIGSHVARKLVTEGCEVYALVRPNSNTWRINDVVHSLNVVSCDFFATEQLNKHLEQIKPEICVHLAWYVEPKKYLNSPKNFEFVSASQQLASQLANLGCKRFVGIGTCFEYDTDLGYLSESSALRPLGAYGASKLAFYFLLDQLGKMTGINVSWLRLFYLYGPFEDERRLVPYVICSLLKNQLAEVTKGEQIRDFLHVEDLVEALWEVVRKKLSGVFNVGSGNPIAVRDLVSKLGKLLNREELIQYGELPYPQFEPMFVCTNNLRLKKEAEWIPQYNLEDGLCQTIDWWESRLGLHR